MTARGGAPTPTELRNMGRWGYLPTMLPTPSEPRNGGTVTYHTLQRNETLGF
jgi:hypothetical protein